ncbi:hypothetical protein ACJX0J_036345 [Zea mays]
MTFGYEFFIIFVMFLNIDQYREVSIQFVLPFIFIVVIDNIFEFLFKFQYINHICVYLFLYLPSHPMGTSDDSEGEGKDSGSMHYNIFEFILAKIALWKILPVAGPVSSLLDIA